MLKNSERVDDREKAYRGNEHPGRAQLAIIAIPEHTLRFDVIRLLSKAGYPFVCAKNLPKLCHEIAGLREEALLVIDIFAYPTTLVHALSKAEHVTSVFLLDKGNEPYSRRFAWYHKWLGIQKEQIKERLILTLQQAVGMKPTQEEPSPKEKVVCSMEKKEVDFIHKEMTRRSFLKGTAAAAAAAGAAMSGGMKLLSPAEAAGGSEASVEQVFTGVCRGNCATNCAMNVHVRNGKVVKTSKLDMPLPEFERICQRSLTHNQRIYQPNRLKYPMRRVGSRGSGEWEQITWDEAIDEICTKWKKYQKENGNASVAYCEGYGTSAPEVDYYMRLFNLMGATHIENAIDRSTIDGNPITTGVTSWLYGDDPRSMQSSKYIFVWGCNATESGHVGYAYLQKALASGAKLIVIDPNYTIVATKADMYVPIRPATDAVLVFAMTNIAIAEGKIDENTLAYGTVAPFLVKKSDGKYLRLSDLGQAEAGSAEDAIVVRAGDGTIGIPADIEKPVIHGNFKIQGHDVTTAYDLLLERIAEWTPERASEICDIPLDTIYELAHMYAKGPSALYLALGQDHWCNGPNFYYAVSAMAMVTGQIGKLGTGIHGASTSLFVAGSLLTGHIFNPKEATPGPSMHAPLIPDAVATGKYGSRDINIKSLFIYKHNLLGNQTDRQKWLKTFDQIDFIVVPDMIMNETTKYADLVLPVPHFFEVETYMVTYSGVAAYNQKAIEPPGDAMGDFEIATLIGKGMGFGDMFTMTREDFIRETLNNDGARAMGLTWETVKEKKHIPLITPETPIYINGENFVYPTATGRAQFYKEDMKPTTDYGQKFDPRWEGLPYWEPPYEAWTETVDKFERNPLADQYPLIFMSERPKFRSHTSYAHNPWHKELLPEPTVTFNPQDAKRRGIKHGDIVRLHNDRGYLLIKAEINAGNRPGILMIEHGWVEDEFIEGHYSDLSSCKTNHAVINNAYYDCLVEAEKV